MNNPGTSVQLAQDVNPLPDWYGKSAQLWTIIGLLSFQVALLTTLRRPYVGVRKSGCRLKVCRRPSAGVDPASNTVSSLVSILGV